MHGIDLIPEGIMNKGWKVRTVRGSGSCKCLHSRWDHMSDTPEAMDDHRIVENQDVVARCIKKAMAVFALWRFGR